jgi:hypothetical protein
MVSYKMLLLKSTTLVPISVLPIAMSIPILGIIE